MAFGRKDNTAEAEHKATAAEPRQENKLPATQDGGSRSAAPAFLRDREQHGAGASTKREDNKVPMVALLQTNSPQAVKRGSEYIDGAEPGDFWMQNAPCPIVKGEDGFEFQPCSFVTKFVEWIHRDDGGGFVAAYDEMPKEAREKPDRKDPKKMVWTMPNGNAIKETKYYTGFARFNNLTMPYVIPMSSSFLTPSKNWMGMITSKMNERGVIYDIWTSWYRLTTKMRKKGENEWFVPVIHDVGFISTEDEDARGKVLHDAVMSGEKTFDASQEHNSSDDGAADSDQGGRM